MLHSRNFIERSRDHGPCDRRTGRFDRFRTELRNETLTIGFGTFRSARCANEVQFRRSVEFLSNFSVPFIRHRQRNRTESAGKFHFRHLPRSPLPTESFDAFHFRRSASAADGHAERVKVTEKRKSVQLEQFILNPPNFIRIPHHSGADSTRSLLIGRSLIT